MEATMVALEERDLPYAGLGRTLADAYAPAYVDTPGGRVALVSACSTITRGDEAGEQRPDLQGRPGLAPLALDTTYVVPEAHYEAVTALAEGLGLEAVKRERVDAGFRMPGVDDDGYAFLDPRAGVHLTFEAGDEFAVERTPTEAHAEAVLESVREAERQADWVVASLHVHHGAGARYNDPSVPAFLESFARECVDAGADAFLGHGPHVLRGVEVYDGAPVFYSLGDLMMQNETVTRLPAELYRKYDLDTQRARPADLFDARVRDEDGERIGFLGDRDFWDSVVPVCEFGADGVERVTLYPAELGYDRPRGDRGVPREATGEDATRILDRVRERSAPYGTELRVEDGAGVLEP
jgi:poly-gamma-glutamate synthesis protein (capsule biosynthesis protein)